MSESSAKQQMRQMEEKACRLINERDTEISHLQKQIKQLTTRLNKTKTKKRNLTAYQSTIRESESKDSTTNSSNSNRRKHILKSEKSRLGRNASIGTSKVLNSLALNDEDKMEEDSTIQRIMTMFKDPTGHIQYLKSELFARDVLKLCQRAR